MSNKNQGGCTCQGCGKNYKIDIIIPDELWEQIKPHGKPKGSGLLCGICIFQRIENIFANKYKAFFLKEDN